MSNRPTKNDLGGGYKEVLCYKECVGYDDNIGQGKGTAVGPVTQ